MPLTEMWVVSFLYKMSYKLNKKEGYVRIIGVNSK